MTSSFSIVKQKALEKLGQVAITNDAVYSNLRTNITLLCDTVNGLRDRVNCMMTHYQEMASNSCEIARNIHGLYDGSGQYLEGASAANAANRKTLRDDLLPNIKVLIQDQVINDIEAWAAELDALQLKMAAREEARVCMDHFKAKLVSIRASREKYTARGRAFPRKDAERLERNERKLEKARAEFQTTNEQCCQLMQAAWNKRFTNINEVFVKLVQSEDKLAALVQASARACLEPVEKARPLAIESKSATTAAPTLTIEYDDATAKTSGETKRSENNNGNVFDLFGTSASQAIVLEPESPSGSRKSSNGFLWDQTATTTHPTLSSSAPTRDPFTSLPVGGRRPERPAQPDRNDDPFGSYEPVQSRRPDPPAKLPSGLKQATNARPDLFADWET
ncbi:BAR domain-containing protein [Plasmodiophora brassicae]